MAENSEVVDTVDNTDDLSAFEADFFQTSNKEVVEEKVDVSDDDPVDPVEDAPEDQDEPLEDDDPKDKPEPKKKQTAQERISELTAARKEAERKAEQAVRELEELKAAKQPKDNQEPKVEDKGPSPDDEVDGEPKYPLGEFDPQYIRDLTKFTLKQESEALRAETQRAQAEAQQEAVRAAVVTEWQGKLDAIEDTIPDIRTKAASLEETFSNIEPNYGEYLAMTIMSLDHGPEVLNYLADNKDEARRIVAMGATKATVALGRIEAKFDKPQEDRVRSSDAPPPPPRNRGGSSVKTISPNTDNLDDFEKIFFKKR